MDFFTSRQNMVESQVRVNDVTNPDIQKAMRHVERERLCAPSQAFVAYAEFEPEISPDRHLMPARDLAKLLQAMAPKSGETALALAAPYGGAVLAHMGLKVTVQEADARTISVVGPYLEELGVTTKVADLTQISGHYDVIIIEGAVGEVHPNWIKALKPSGRLAVIIKDGVVGKGQVMTKYDGVVASKELFDSPTSWLKGFEKQTQFVF